MSASVYISYLTKLKQVQISNLNRSESLSEIETKVIKSPNQQKPIKSQVQIQNSTVPSKKN